MDAGTKVVLGRIGNSSAPLDFMPFWHYPSDYEDGEVEDDEIYYIKNRQDALEVGIDRLIPFCIEPFKPWKKFLEENESAISELIEGVIESFERRYNVTINRINCIVEDIGDDRGSAYSVSVQIYNSFNVAVGTDRDIAIFCAIQSAVYDAFFSLEDSLFRDQKRRVKGNKKTKKDKKKSNEKKVSISRPTHPRDDGSEDIFFDDEDDDGSVGQ